MLTCAKDVYTVYDDNLVSINIENGVVDNFRNILGISLGEVKECFGISIRCLHKTVTVWILTNSGENSTGCICYINFGGGSDGRDVYLPCMWLLPKTGVVSDWALHQMRQTGRIFEVRGALTLFDVVIHFERSDRIFFHQH